MSTSQSQSKSKSYYDVLGITKSATDKDIKKAYKRLAMIYHPDKADDSKKDEHTKKFQEIREANEVLSDPEKRKIYDEFGIDGLDESKRHAQARARSQDPFNPIFDMFPGMFATQNRQPSGPRKNQDTLYNISISLSQAYTGVTKKFKVTKDTIVNTHITPPEPVFHNFESTWNSCTTCSGQGTVLEQTRFGNMIQMNQRKCNVCNGSCYNLKTGYEIKQLPETVSLDVPKGVKNGTQIRLHNKGSCMAGTLPGDIVVVVQASNSECGFTRNNDDLRYTHNIVLSEALCGGKLKIKTLDNRELFIKFGPINIGDIKIIKGEGIKLQNGNNGDLYINFDIVFPKLSKEQQIEIKKILPENSNDECVFEDSKIKYII